MNLFVEENYVDETQGYRYGDTGPYETSFDNPGDLYRYLRSEYGRPSKMYVDSNTLGTVQVGWCFTKRVTYDDDPKSKFKRTVWVTVFEACPADDPRALHWNHGKPRELDEDQSLRELVIAKGN